MKGQHVYVLIEEDVDYIGKGTAVYADMDEAIRIAKFDIEKNGNKIVDEHTAGDEGWYAAHIDGAGIEFRSWVMKQEVR